MGFDTWVFSRVHFLTFDARLSKKELEFNWIFNTPSKFNSKIFTNIIHDYSAPYNKNFELDDNILTRREVKSTAESFLN